MSYLAFIVLVFLNGFCFCQSYRDDSLAVRKVLDANALIFRKVSDFTLIDSTERISELFFNGVKIDTIPPAIGELTNLESFRIYSNDRGMYLRSLPNEIGRLSKLKAIQLYGTAITSLPDSIVMLKNLESIWITSDIYSECHLMNLPDSIGLLTNLKSLNIFGGRFLNLPASIGSLTNLVSLELRKSTYLFSLPKEIGNLSKLNKLAVSSFQWDAVGIPPSICNLMSLDTLDLSDGYLRKLPDGLGNLSALKTLFLQDNLLDSLPKSLMRLGCINMNVSNNYLRIQDSLFRLFLDNCCWGWRQSQNTPIKTEESHGQIMTHIFVSPNPFRSSTIISFKNLKKVSKVEIYNISGMVVASYKDLNNKQLNANFSSLSAGTYVLKIKADNATFSKIVLLLK